MMEAPAPAAACNDGSRHGAVGAVFHGGVCMCSAHGAALCWTWLQVCMYVGCWQKHTCLSDCLELGCEYKTTPWLENTL